MKPSGEKRRLAAEALTYYQGVVYPMKRSKADA